MKNIVRAFAFALVATGAAASFYINPTPAQTVLAQRSAAVPTPMCPPDDPAGCGVCAYTKTCAIQ